MKITVVMSPEAYQSLSNVCMRFGYQDPAEAVSEWMEKAAPLVDREFGSFQPKPGILKVLRDLADLLNQGD